MNIPYKIKERIEEYNKNYGAIDVTSLLSHAQTQFPEFAFGESDCVDRAEEGLESHPRLMDTELYRAADSNTIMKQARETILGLAPEGFSISLSTCLIILKRARH